MIIFSVIPAWVWLCLSGAFFAFGEFLSKKFALNPGWSIFGFIILVDFLSITTWLPAIFEKNQLSSTGVAWSVLSLIMTVVIGIIIFGEKLTILQVVGIMLGVAAVTLLSV